MKTATPPSKTTRSHATSPVQRKGQPTAHQVDNRPTGIAQRKLQESIAGSMGPIQRVRGGASKGNDTKGKDNKSKNDKKVEPKKPIFEVSPAVVVPASVAEIASGQDVATYLTKGLYQAMQILWNDNQYEENVDAQLSALVESHNVPTQKVGVVIEAFHNFYGKDPATGLLSAAELKLLNEGGDLEKPNQKPKKGARPDIEEKFNSLKACAITALMYVEGEVLGAKSAEGLHNILVTHHKNSWRHYSEPKVYGSLYGVLGYSKKDVIPNIKLEDYDTSKMPAEGMVQVKKGINHMIGFKRDGDKLIIKDNEGGNKYADGIVMEIWSKGK